MSLLPFILSAFLVLPVWTLFALYQNYQVAVRTNLPCVISPVNPFNPLWILLRPYINPVLTHLPFNLGRFTAYNYLGWSWRDKNYLHTIHGPVFMIVTPAENQLIVGDAKASDAIFKFSTNFPKNPAFNDVLNIFGHNVSTAEGNAWKRQRKITTAAFNERNSSLVWSEAVKQAKQMLATWTAGTPVTSTVDDTSLFALHVLSGAGFGLSYDFDSSFTSPAAGHTMSYRDALKTIMGNLFVTFAIMSATIPTFLLPRKFSMVLEAITEFKKYMVDMVNSERIAYDRGEGPHNANLMASLIRASEEARQEGSNGDAGSVSLTDDEIWGNLFVYNVAGRETTASTLAYAIALLACYPQWQNWLREELDHAFQNSEVDEIQYQEVYPRLRRCLAIMVGCAVSDLVVREILTVPLVRNPPRLCSLEWYTTLHSWITSTASNR
jgi:cytochrome P450